MLSLAATAVAYGVTYFVAAAALVAKSGYELVRFFFLLTFAALMGGFLQYNGLPVTAALIALTLPSNSGERLWRMYFVGSLATLPALAKLGASSNYWLELSAATAAILALASYRLGQSGLGGTSTNAQTAATGAASVGIGGAPTSTTIVATFPLVA